MYKTIDEIPADLRELAEHEWPQDGSDEQAIDGWARHWLGDVSPEPTYMSPRFHGTVYSKDQHQRARDIISGKPGWGEAPEGALVLIQGDDGGWIFGTYRSAEVREITSDWVGIGLGRWDIERKKPGKILGDWRKTLEHRPADLGNELLDGDAPMSVTTPTDYRDNRIEDALTEFGYTSIEPGSDLPSFTHPDTPVTPEEDEAWDEKESAVTTSPRALRVSHSDGYIDVEIGDSFGGYLALFNDAGDPVVIPDEQTLDAVYAAAKRIYRGR